MAKPDDLEQSLDEGIEIGKKNKELLPKVRNWCKHIQIEDVSGGMIAQVYNLPLTLRVSCPHAHPEIEGMNFEGISRDFILENCRSCQFHKEVHRDNFGTEVINEYEKQKIELERLKLEEKKKKKVLKKRVEKLVNKEKSDGEITSLSILKIIQSFDEGDHLNDRADKILEASKLSPNFFSEVALDSLSLYFEDKDFGTKILQAVKNVLKTGKDLSNFALDRLTSTIRKNCNLDNAVGVLNYVKVDDIREYDDLINSIINSVWYKRRFGDPFDNRPSYPNTVNFLKNIHDRHEVFLTDLLKKHLEINEKTKRININYLLQELCSVDPEIVSPHITALIKSLELEDDNYEESADGITCMTLSKIYEYAPKAVIIEIDKTYDTLTTRAKIELYDFYRLVLSDNQLFTISEILTNQIIDKVIKLLLDDENYKGEKEKILTIIEEVSRKNPSIFATHFEILIGFYIDQVKELEKFNWYLKELEKPKNKISTFNPLQNLNSLEIQNQRLAQEKAVREAKKVLKNLIEGNSDSDGHEIFEIISNLDSKSEGLLKSNLIAILRESVTDPVVLANFMPSIYNFLLDTESLEVRYEGIDFVAYLIEKNDQLVTQTLIDVIKVFISDQQVGIKGKALKTFGWVLIKFPEQIEQKQIQTILESLLDNYVYIHKSAAELSSRLYPFLSTDQKVLLIHRLMILEDHYYNKEDYRYSQELVDILLRITKETKLYSSVVKKILVKYCNSKNYHIEKKYIEKLTRIRDQFSKFNNIWLKQTIEFLTRTRPERYNQAFDVRNRLYDTFYKLNRELILKNIDRIKELIRKKVDEGVFSDAFELYSILSFYSLHKDLREVSIHFENVVEPVRSNDYALEKNLVFKEIAYIESVVADQSIDKSFIKSIQQF